MVIFDLVMHHGGKVTKLTSASFDRIRNKLFRVVANGESKIVSINAKNEIVTYDRLNKLPKAEQDKIIDATLIDKKSLQKTKAVTILPKDKISIHNPKNVTSLFDYRQ